ncbi:MAG TPA: ATP-binding cassette domain-containing protein [Actinocrinis sp.]|jgi:ABC-type sugar transport system ATPase subunit
MTEPFSDETGADFGARPGDQSPAGIPEQAAGPDSAAADAIRVEHVAKRFGPVTALRDINMHVRRGEVLGLIGDNGAGKSTLIKILTGFHRPDSGVILVNGVETRLTGVRHARSLGIETVYQDLALIDGLSVYLNLHLNKELVHKPVPFLRRAEMKRRASAALASVGIDIPSLSAEVGTLSGGQRQAIAVARAVYSDAKILLLDEPLAAMGAREGGQILQLLRTLRERGDLAIVVIAHNYSQIVDVCDRVNLLQHGEITFDRPTAQTSVAELNELVHAEYRIEA